MGGIACWLMPSLCGVLVGWLLNWLFSLMMRKDQPPKSSYAASAPAPAPVVTPTPIVPKPGAPTPVTHAEVTQTPVAPTSPAPAPAPVTPKPMGAPLKATAAKTAAVQAVTGKASPSKTTPVRAAPVKAPPVKAAVADVAAARAAGFTMKDAEDLTILQGVGPKINELMKANGVKTFADIARSSVPDLQKVLAAGGQLSRLANPETWPRQAQFAVDNRWADLKAYQDQLGRKSPGPAKS